MPFSAAEGGEKTKKKKKKKSATPMGIPSEDGMPQLLTIIHLVPTECHYKKKPFQQENIMKIYIAAFILLRLMLE